MTRREVLAHRVAANQLGRGKSDPVALGVLDLGVQDTPAGSAAGALGARLPEPLDQDLSGTGLALAWSHRERLISTGPEIC